MLNANFPVYYTYTILYLNRCPLPPVKVGAAEEVRRAREERRRLIRVELNNRCLRNKLE